MLELNAFFSIKINVYAYAKDMSVIYTNDNIMSP